MAAPLWQTIIRSHIASLSRKHLQVLSQSPPPPISVYLLIEFISQAVREENTQVSSSVLCVSSRRCRAVSLVAAPSQDGLPQIYGLFLEQDLQHCCP